MDLTLDVLGDPVWSYAYAGTRRSVVKAITLHQGGALPPHDITVIPRVTLEFPFAEPLAPVWEGRPRTIDSRAQNVGVPISWDRVDLDIDYLLASRVMERVEGRARVEIIDTDTGGVIATATKNLSLLAPNQWLSEPSYDEVIAAFVLPSDPYVAEILTKARELLAQRTGNSATGGYQGEVSPLVDDRPLSERSRPYQIAHAIYDAMSSMGYAYSNPPGLFDGGAQRVRTPSQVKMENCATCLDSSVLMAACFAQAGLEPLVFLVEGHAFAGYLTGAPLRDAGGQLIMTNGDAVYGESAVDRVRHAIGPALRRMTDYGVIQQFFRLGFIQAVETTTTTDSFHRPFHEACASQNNFSVDHDETLESVVCVANAWRAGITPPVSLADVPLHLGAAHGQPRLRDDDQTSTSDRSWAIDGELEDRSMSPEERATPPRVRQWLASLLDLSSRNPLLKVKSTSMLEFEVPASLLGTIDDVLYTPKSKLQVVSPAELPFNWVLEGASQSEFETWANREKKLVFPPHTQLNGIQGVAEAYLAAVRGASGDPIRGFDRATTLDIEAIRADRAHYFHSSSDAQILTYIRETQLARLRSALKNALSKVQTKAKESMLTSGTNSLYLALGTVSWSESSEFRGKGKATSWCAPLYLYPVLLEGGKGSPNTLRLDPNGDATPNYCLHEKLKRPPYNLDLKELVNPIMDDKGLDLSKTIGIVQRRLRDAKLDNFAVQPRALLGVFDYSTFRLWKDFKDSWKQMTEISASAKHLIYTPNQPFTADPPLPEPRLEPYLPIAADDSQRDAVQWALDGRSFRLEGPPGTGKSQTITNLLASCIANNKKVLFVAEKQTALNAVKERLEDAGLGHYCLNLHAKGDSDTRLRKNIKDALTTAIAQRIDPRDSEWQDLNFRLKKDQEVLDRYREALHVTEGAMSAWVANEERLGLGTGDLVEVPQRFVEQFEERWPQFQNAAAQIDQAVDLVGEPAVHRWRFVDQCLIQEQQYSQLAAALLTVVDSCTELRAKGEAWIGLVERAGSSNFGALADAVALRVAGGLSNVDAIAHAEQSGAIWADPLGNDMLLREVVDECARLTAQMALHGAVVSPDFLDHGKVAAVEAAVQQWARATASAELRAVVESWTALSTSVASRIPSGAADQLLGRDDLVLVQRALDELESPEHQRVVADLMAATRPLKAAVEAHAANVGTGLLARTDLVNVGLLVTDAESAGMMSKKKKFKALRDLLGADALASDDRMLLFSLKEILSLRATADALKERIARELPESAGINVRPWVDEDLTKAVGTVRAARLRALETALNVEGPQLSDVAMVSLARATIELAPTALAALEVLRTQLPDEASTLYRPWDAAELVRLTNTVAQRHAAAVAAALGDAARTSDAQAVALSAFAWLEAREAIDAVRRKVATELCPQRMSTFDPWNEADAAALPAARQQFFELTKFFSNSDVATAFEAVAPGVTQSDAELLQHLSTGWAQLMTCLVTSDDSWAVWSEGRDFVTAVSDRFPALQRDGGENHRFLELTRWLSLRAALTELEPLGLSSLAPIVLENTMSIDQLVAATRRSAIGKALRMRLEDANLDRFDRKVHERRIRSFEAAMAESRELLKVRIPGLVNKRRTARALPTGNDVGGTAALLRGLTPVRGERTPIRDLISKYGNALADAMPCFLMSPDSVATLVPVGAIAFDLVVFDEASQVRTAHAVGALGRGKAGIVVGDSRQMPPSTAFSSNSGAYVDDVDVEDDEDDVVQVDDSDLAEDGSLEALLRPEAAPDAESILSEFNDSQFPHLQLLCHYRSKDELLIAFSNTHIYDTPMLTFPSTTGLESTALRFVHVPDGFFERDKQAAPHVFTNSPASVPSLRTNRREAEEVVTETLRRLNDPARRRRREADPEKKAESIIIVTFNTQQMRLIEAMLRDADPDLFDIATSEGEADELTGKRTPPQLKIRNLESVQGDEAELVIFSVAFSRTKKGTFPLNFGPVTQPGGDRRLNVAVTRAQHEMIVFGSFLPEEMATGGKVLSEQALMVQRFIALACHGPQRSVDVGVDVARSRHIEDLAQALRERGYETHTQLGLSTLRVDIAVRRPGSNHWQLAIMVDDLCWSERGSAYQREVLPRQVLPALGWGSVVRIWMPSWLNERDEILSEIDAVMNGAEQETDIDEIDEIVDPIDTTQSSIDSAGQHAGFGSSATVMSSAGSNEEGLTNRLSSSATSAGGSSASSSSSSTTPVNDERRFSEFVAYEVVVVGDVTLLDQGMRNPTLKALVDTLLTKVLATEGPIELERLVKIIGRSFGLGRISADRLVELKKLVPRQLVRKDVVGSFVWAAEGAWETWKDYRTSLDKSERLYEEISAVEYRNALVDIVEKSHIVEHDAALREVARVFGFKRITGNADSILRSALKQAVKDGHVRLVDGEFLPV